MVLGLDAHSESIPIYNPGCNEIQTPPSITVSLKTLRNHIELHPTQRKSSWISSATRGAWRSCESPKTDSDLEIKCEKVNIAICGSAGSR